MEAVEFKSRRPDSAPATAGALLLQQQRLTVSGRVGDLLPISGKLVLTSYLLNFEVTPAFF
jgi:hypothetical protein